MKTSQEASESLTQLEALKAKGIELEDKASDALQSKERLESNFALLNQCWRNEIRWKGHQLEMATAASGEVDLLVQLESYFVQNENLLSSDITKLLPELDRLISLILVTLTRMGALANSDDRGGDMNLQRLCQLCATIAGAVTATTDSNEQEEKVDLSQVFNLLKEEVAKQIAISNKSSTDDMEADVDGEINRLVYNFLFFPK